MEVALGLGSLVLLAGGTTAMVRRDLTPTAAAGIVAVAVMVAVVTLAARAIAGSGYAAAVIAPTALGGVLTAVLLASRARPTRRR